MSTITQTDRNRVAITRFGECILKSRMTLRSNSARRKFFDILHGTIVRHSSSIREARYALDALRSTSAYDRDERNFQACVKAAISVLPPSDEIFATMRDLLAEVVAERHFDQIVSVLEGTKRQAEFVDLFNHAVREQNLLEKRSELHRELERI